MAVGDVEARDDVVPPGGDRVGREANAVDDEPIRQRHLRSRDRRRALRRFGRGHDRRLPGRRGAVPARVPRRHLCSHRVADVRRGELVARGGAVADDRDAVPGRAVAALPVVGEGERLRCRGHRACRCRRGPAGPASGGGARSAQGGLPAVAGVRGAGQGRGARGGAHGGGRRAGDEVARERAAVELGDAVPAAAPDGCGAAGV